MSAKQISIDALNNHLFEAIEMLKNNNDPNADNNEKIDLETARTIASLAKPIIEGYKIKAQVLKMISETESPKIVSEMAIGGGIIEGSDVKQIPDKTE
jgi:hypothetical protein